MRRLVLLLLLGACAAPPGGGGFGPEAVVCRAGAPCAVESLAALSPELRDPGEGESPAVSALRAAAEAGDPEAAWRLSQAMLRGAGVRRRSHEALSWMRRAAEGGSRPAQAALGRIHLTGLEEMGQDLAEARLWLDLAASGGEPTARRDLAALERAEREERDARWALARWEGETRAYWYAPAPAGWAYSPAWGYAPWSHAPPPRGYGPGWGRRY